jgi:hypothetical protein
MDSIKAYLVTEGGEVPASRSIFTPLKAYFNKVGKRKLSDFYVGTV